MAGGGYCCSTAKIYPAQRRRSLESTRTLPPPQPYRPLASQGHAPYPVCPQVSVSGLHVGVYHEKARVAPGGEGVLIGCSQDVADNVLYRHPAHGAHLGASPLTQTCGVRDKDKNLMAGGYAAC